MIKPIYLDYNATTPIAVEVAEAMIPYLYEHYGNPSSSHPYGITAKKAVDHAREQVAGLLNCLPDEIIFTSGGTESNNFAIRGIALASINRGNHIITSAVEHPAVIEVCRWLGKNGFDITILPVDHYGMVDPADLKEVIRPDTILVTIMHANNEVGTIQPLHELARISRDYGAYFHTDAAQSLGKIPVDVDDIGVDLLSLAGHKLYAPKGIGVLYVREGVHLTNLMFGAGHEGGRRPGTENVLEIIGLGTACEIAARDMKKNQRVFLETRDRLFQGLVTELGRDYVRLNGHPEACLPNTLSVGFRGLNANDFLVTINHQVAASAGSACHANQIKVSAVLEAMRIPLEWALGTVRFSVGRDTTIKQIEKTINAIVFAVNNFKKTYFNLETP